MVWSHVTLQSKKTREMEAERKKSKSMEKEFRVGEEYDEKGKREKIR